MSTKTKFYDDPRFEWRNRDVDGNKIMPKQLTARTLISYTGLAFEVLGLAVAVVLLWPVLLVIQVRQQRRIRVSRALYEAMLRQPSPPKVEPKTSAFPQRLE